MDSDMSTDPIVPGGSYFSDVTDAFREASADMTLGSVIFLDGFTLQDAMSAFEIGEPRLDSGAVSIPDDRPPFNPLTPLLPEELCWILDRSLAYEMEWHAGSTLSQTVFTLQFTHQFDEINPDLHPLGFMVSNDASRPGELITLVLRAAILGLLKCCDLAWRELQRSSLHDGEDWQSEKCDISMLEGVPVQFVLNALEEAGNWILNSSKVPEVWRDALHSRIMLRRTLLEIMNTDIYNRRMQFQDAVSRARTLIQSIRKHASPFLLEDSPAHNAFDPLIGRQLNSFIPLRVIEVPTHGATLDIVEGLVDELEQICILSTITSISTWNVFGYLRAWSPQPCCRLPYIRALTQSTFCSGILILNKYPPRWVVERFFLENLGITYDVIVKTIEHRWTGATQPLLRIERLMIHFQTLLNSHIKCFGSNPPRFRRHLARSLVDWHALYDEVSILISDLGPHAQGGADILAQLPNAVLHWRFSIVREVVLSGFQQELYSAEEKVFAYWYIIQVVEAHVACLDGLISVVLEDFPSIISELKFQRDFLTAMKHMCSAMFIVLKKTLVTPWDRMRLNFLRRYKWAFRPEYDDTETPVVALPEYYKFLASSASLFKNGIFSPGDSMSIAKRSLKRLSDIESPAGCAGPWAAERKQFVCALEQVCDNLSSLPSLSDLTAFDVSVLKWDPKTHPWFPEIVDVSIP